MYEMLTGEQPFTSPTAQAVIAKRFTETPPEVTKARPAVPVAAARAITKLLERTPADRFATGAQLVEALRPGASPAPAVTDEHSIAVLPLANLSADPDNEYFSDGITEEIINALSRLDALHVASRTSSFTFKGRGHDLKAVSAKLHVKHVLEGSVRRAGARVRIAVQLVDVERDVTVWSERYDRQIDDIFAVQDEIATAIAGKLEATLGGARPTSLVTAGTVNVEAYEEYLKGRHFWTQRGPGLAHAVPHFLRATELDPGFAAAFAGLADSYGLYGLYGLVAQTESWPMARAAAERAIALDPGDAEVQYAAAAVDLWFGWDLRRAAERFRAATRINPRHARAWAWLAQMHGLLGEMDVVRESAPRAHEADPLSPLIGAIVATGFIFGGCYDDAIRYTEGALEIDPGNMVANWVRGYAFSALGQHGDAVAACERSVTTMPSGLTLTMLAVVCARAGRAAEVEAVRARLAAVSYPRWLDALVLAAQGQVDQAVDAATVAVQERHWLAWGGGCIPFAESVTEHPRWQAAMREVGLAWVVERRLRHNAERRA